MTTCKLYLAWFDKIRLPIIAPSIEYLNNVRATDVDFAGRDIRYIEVVNITPQNYLTFSEKYDWFFKNLNRAMINGRRWLINADAIRWHELVWLAWKLYIIEDEAWALKKK